MVFQVGSLGVEEMRRMLQRQSEEMEELRRKISEKNSQPPQQVIITKEIVKESVVADQPQSSIQPKVITNVAPKKVNKWKQLAGSSAEDIEPPKQGKSKTTVEEIITDEPPKVKSTPSIAKPQPIAEPDTKVTITFPLKYNACFAEYMDKPHDISLTQIR